MRAVVQRVSQSSVRVDGKVVGEIKHGLIVLIGVLQGDTKTDIDFMARKLATLRVFHDDDGKMNKSIIDVGGEILLVSQFTLAADTTSGTRPSFSSAMPPETANEIIEVLKERLTDHSIKVETGEFGAIMDVEIHNDGPVTIIIDSKNKK